ncbi:Endonuclease/exonuclease/phosphatase [Metarhizium robertsii ARSEF 23]|uniref:Endonuclease/exonuclease/phosphatase n=1 Tax=Metarhizium robertsii (strain ARSEF 23 / ATCC MYA-3075) TaxID=655844 RepID=E9FA09_METRA|nr:Endonuclease/exonuclease/phosphatase [Metarhizium robertsii ARSEF 23]EFY95407.2 Endonuclease/exonuclease/phosphatase [Metarhizium robertsii ARSEF 23]
MATAITSPPRAPNPFDLGVYSPPNLAQGARAALLRDSSPAETTDIGVSPASYRTPQTHSSPLNRTSNAAITEGQQLLDLPALRTSVTHKRQQPVDITEAATRLANEQIAVHDAKLRVFRTFCAHFNEAAKGFTTGPERDFAKHFSDSFLDFWNKTLTSPKSSSVPTYSSVAANANGLRSHAPTTHNTNTVYQQQPPAPAHRQGQPPAPDPPREDLRVFIRLDADAPARNHIGYAIRAHVASKIGIDLSRIPQVLQVNTGWAIRAIDRPTRDLLVERQAEWAEDLGATAVETSQKWYTYAVANCPRRLTDLYGNELDYAATARDEIINQTGLTPVSVRAPRRDNELLPYKTLIVSLLEPTKRPWSLFGTSRPARLIEKKNPPKQCENCWDYHTRHACNRQTRCKRCGKSDHTSDGCTAAEQCANCLGPHTADLVTCPARPKRVHGMLQRLSREQRALIRQMGSQLHQQRQHTAQQNQQTRTATNCTSVAETVTDQRAPTAATEPSQARVIAHDWANFFAVNRPELPTRTGTTLKVFQANVGKIPPAHDCALALADSEKYDIVLLQEPWTEAKHSRCLTKTHPAYDTYSPVDSWNSNDTRPRVMTYIRKDSRILADQKRPSLTRDILWITVNGITIVNFYRQPHCDVALDVLLRWSAPERTLVAGDFNAKHYSWQTGRLEDRGEDVASWAADNGLSLLNTADVPTNPHGNTIDLAFSNIALASAVVEDHLATSSDHFTLSLMLPDIGLSLPQVPGKVRVTTEEELKRFRELVAAGACRIPIDTATASQLDTLATALVDLLQAAARAAGRPVRKGSRSAPWWTDECAEAAAEYRAIRRIFPLGFNQEVQLARKEFQRVVRHAKRQYWRNLIDGFSDSASVYRAVRWLKSPGAFQPTPLQIDDVVYETQIDKANALRRSTLERRTAADDIADPWIPVHPARKIPFVQEITLEEAEDATIKTGNTSPGADNITVKLLRAVWDVIGGHVRHLYDGCLSLGHHPKAFREAEVVMIPKPGRRNLSTPRAWRPISLLSCLGKGLERLIARRLAWASIHYGVLHSQQAGALPKRSAVDLVAALIHDIEEAFARGEVATLVTADIQGAFDTAMCNRLVLRLRSFMSGRSARVRYQDITTPTTPLQCGLPQGPPVSPILFLLCTEPIYRLGNPEGRFGYADDTAILCTGQSLEETARKASEHIQELVSWGAANGVSFDPEKTEVMHFSLKTRGTTLPIRHGDVVKHPEAAMRWLGIWLDGKLTFKTHVEKWTAKAQAVARHLRGLGNTRRGPSPSAMQRAVRACVEPILLFGAEAWYPGTTSPRLRQPKTVGPSKIQQLVKRMSKALKQAIRAILPTWRTTPITALHRESGIPPVLQLLETRRLRFSARIKSLDLAHLLVKRTVEETPRPVIKAIKLKFQLQPKNFPTRLRRTNELLANSQRPTLIPRTYSDEPLQPLQTASKEESAEDFVQWLQTIPPFTLIVYSDGSLSPNGAAGYGYAVHQSGRSICQGAGRLGPAEVFDAEAKGALEGLKAALRLPQSVTQKIFVCLDNIAAARCLRGKPSESSQRVFLTFQALAKTHRMTEVRWIPGHTKIPGNEQADVLAKAGCAQPEPADAVPTLAFLRRTARQRAKIAVQAWWDASAPDKYQSLTLKFPSSCPPELGLPRTILHHLLAARTHHGDFADYHERFRHDNACIICSCGRRKAPTHLFYCRKIQPRCRMRLAPSPTVAINQALGRDFDKFVKLVKALLL